MLGAGYARTDETSQQEHSMMARRIAQVGLDGALFERDVTRTLERVGKHGGLTIQWPIARSVDKLGHSGVQPWSAGAIFPAIITVVDRYDEQPMGYLGAPIHFSTSYKLTLDRHSEEYATWDDAERVARALLERPDMRASWNEDDTYPAHRYVADAGPAWNGDAYGVI